MRTKELRGKNFQQRAKASLSLYRSDILGVPEQGVWKRNGQVYGHILPVRQQGLNLLPSIRERFWHSPQIAIKLHPDFHHLTSSQALCFNLFYLLLASETGLNALLSELHVAGQAAEGACFEFRPHEVERTSIDFMLPLACGGRVLFEVKYTEREFGRAKDDEDHRKRYRTLYEPEFRGRFADGFTDMSGFFKNYQIMRNVWHLREGADDTVVFLVPRANEALQKHVASVSLCATETVKARVRLVYLEDLIRALRLRCAGEERLLLGLEEFREKYLPYSVTGQWNA